ncbi:Zinc finger C2H2 type protein [Microdochium nivale]|nr:Zinc finger C2H2 type protein [Microdochium nivale]
MMVFCAYCGKSFTRKEHLERHILSHTNVKPHRCSACQLSFARRDLLQRHHSTYHEARDPLEPGPGGVPTIAGKTPIACLNCAQAKTGCDKRVPCSRCADKNLDCAARFARRSSKVVIRAAQAVAAMERDGQPASSGLPDVVVATVDSTVSPPHRGEGHDKHTPTINPVLMDIDLGFATSQTQDVPDVSSDPVMVIDPLLQQPDHTGSDGSPSISQLSSGAVSPSNLRVCNQDDMMHFESPFLAHDNGYPDMLLWQHLPIGFDTYNGGIAWNRQDMTISAIPNQTDGISSSSSERTASLQGSTSVHTRGTSIASNKDCEHAQNILLAALDHVNDGTTPEFEAVVIAEAGWPLARCNQSIPSATCPRTGIAHLECLEHKSKHEGTWEALERVLKNVERDDTDKASVMPMTARSRDRLLAITQTFLYKALETHRGNASMQHSRQYFSLGQPNFLVLPPSNVLEYFMRCHVRNSTFFFSQVSTGCIDPNDLLSSSTASMLMVLLMIAQGASTVPTAEARALSAGLIETCRVSLFDIMEKDVEMSADPTALQCALLFTLLGSWSGDKWLMDIAMGQRGMYLSMLKHAGMFETQPTIVPYLNSSLDNADFQWRSWLHREAQNRLAYNWVMVDQELSLFHDTAPMLSISELLAPLPSPEPLWLSANSDQWHTAIQSIYGCTANMSPQLLASQPLSPSLFILFQEFLHDALPRGQGQMNPQHLRLLLHPLQSLLSHLRQMLSCFSDVLGARQVSTRTVTKSSTMARLEEVQALLQKWYELSVAYQKADPTCFATKTNLVLYHLISLNAVTNFPEIERLARRDGFDGSYWELSLRHKRCIFQREEAIFHCGQVLRLLRALQNHNRPSWWAVALYRATLILWTDSICRLDPNFQVVQQAGGDNQEKDAGGHASTKRNPVAVDQVTPEDPEVAAYLWNGSGTPVLTGTDGRVFSLEKPADILWNAIHTVQASQASRLCDGIRRKLLALGGNWQLDEFAQQHRSHNTLATDSTGHPLSATTVAVAGIAGHQVAQPPMLFQFPYPHMMPSHGLSSTKVG